MRIFGSYSSFAVRPASAVTTAVPVTPDVTSELATSAPSAAAAARTMHTGCPCTSIDRAASSTVGP
jgi:hypothetical protein